MTVCRSPPPPPAALGGGGGGSEKDCVHHNVSKTRGIITLYRHQRAAFAITSKRGPAPKISKTSLDLPPGSAVGGGADNDEVRRL